MENKHKKLCIIAILIAFMAFATASSISPGGNTTVNFFNNTTSFQGSSITLFLHDDATTDTPYSSKKMLRTFDPTEPINTTTITPSNGNTSIMNWTSDALNVVFIPAGIHTLHMNALKSGGGAGKIDKLFYQCGYVSSDGGNLTIKGTSELSAELTTTSQEIFIDMLMEDQNLNSTDRMFIAVWVNQTGSGANPTVTLQYDDLTDSRLIFPATQQDITGLLNLKINKTGDIVGDPVSELFCLDVLDSGSQFCIAEAGITYVSNITHNIIGFDGSFVLANNYSIYLESNNTTTTISSINGLNMAGKNITNCANCMPREYGSSYYRQFWQKQGAVIAGTWAHTNDAAQTDFSTVTGEAAGVWYDSSNTNGDEYDWNNVYLGNGTYNLTFVTFTSSGNGIVEFLWGSQSLGTFDTYTAVAVHNVVHVFSFTVSTAGKQNLKMKVNGKNGASAGYQIVYSRIQLEKTGEI